MLPYVYFSEVITKCICLGGSSLSEDTQGSQSLRESYKQVKGFQLFSANKKYTRQEHISLRKGIGL